MIKVIIFADGLGTRLSDQTIICHELMVKIRGWSILWHIMKMYSHHSINDFVIRYGYKDYVIKE